jgi:hypothetical protein
MKKNKMKNIGIFFILLASLVFCPDKKAKAGTWGEAIGAEVMHEAWVTARETFKESMVASLKIQANKLISDRVRALLTGSRNGGTIITNYEDFIFRSTERTVQVYTTNLFRSVTQVASSNTRHSIKTAEVALQNELQGGIDSIGATIDDYVSGGSENIFNETKGGGNAALLALVSNPYNNPYGAYTHAQMAINKKMSELSRAKEAEAVAGRGFASKVDKETNLIDLPGSIVSDLVSTAESLPMLMTAYASTIPEVAGSLAAQIVSQTIEMGIAKVTRPIDNELSDINQTVRGGVREVQRDIYKGIKFTD